MRIHSSSGVLGFGIMAESVITYAKASSSSSLNPASRIICHVCQKQFSQYTCPRCNSRYCSLQCYKTHSTRCTESFMRDNVMGELKQLQSEDGTKRKMLEILKRFHSEDEADSMHEDDEEASDSTLSEETIQKALSGGLISLDDLSEKCKKMFLRAVASGELSKMIEPWDPWWLKPSAKTISLGKDGIQLIQPLVKSGSGQSQQLGFENDQLSEIPLGHESPLSPLHKLTSSDPSPLLGLHLVDIVFSYCFTLRLHNGDCQSDALGSSMVVLSVSSALGQAVQPVSMLETLSYCLEQTCSPAFKHMGGLQFGFCVIDDIIEILSLGSSALICLLCDLERLVQAGEKEIKSEKVKKPRDGKLMKKLKLAERKIYFIMCWVDEQEVNAWSSWSSIVMAEKASAMEYYSSGKSSEKMVRKTESKGKALLEEM